MTERCDLSDLPVGQCACRVHAPMETSALRQRVAGKVVATFFARYDSRCDSCDEPIVAGERICTIENLGYVHEDCA